MSLHQVQERNSIISEFSSEEFIVMVLQLKRNRSTRLLHTTRYWTGSVLEATGTASVFS